MPLQVDLLSAADRFLKRDGKVLLATIVDVEGSTYHRPGTRMLIAQNGEHHGSISGGCLEKDLIQKAWFQVRNGPTVVEYDTRIDEDDDRPLPTGPFNTGCHGVVQVLLQVVEEHDSSPFTALKDVYKERKAGFIATVYAVQGESPESIANFVYIDANNQHSIKNSASALWDTVAGWASKFPHTANHVAEGSTSTLKLLIEKVDPQPQLTLFGAGDDAIPLNLLAQQMGWRVNLVDQRTSLANRERFAGAEVIAQNDARALDALDFSHAHAVVLMTHNIARDAELLPSVMAQKPSYVGVLGPASRWQKLLNYWQHQSIEVENLDAVHAPIGLDIGANNAAEIAAAIIAEVISNSNNKQGGRLAKTTQALHKPAKRYFHSI